MPPTLSASDLHPSNEGPELVAALHEFLRRPARAAAALYVIGDIFDTWLGDDQLREPLAAGVASAFATLSASGTPVYLQRGNRDFLLGDRFATASRAMLLPDAVVHTVQDTPTLIMHGDQLCTDDIAYQRYRRYWQDPKHRRQVLALPYFVRRGIAAALRAGSRRAIEGKPEQIMDVNADAVVATLRQHGVLRMIHGHTHRPALHDLVVDGRPAQRWVLADWYRKASYLEISTGGAAPRMV